MGLYDRDYMKSAEWQRRNGCLPTKATELLAKSEEYSVQNSPDKRSKKALRSILIIALLLFIMAMILFSFNTSFSTTQKETYEADQKMLLAQSPKFDTETIDPSENNWHNLFVAAEYLKRWKSSDINKAIKITPKELYKHTWKYIGKLVRLTIEILMPEELPPNNSFSKILNPGKPTTVMLADVDIGGAGDAIQYHYAGPFEGFDAGDKVEICGYVIGKAKNTNRLGGACYNIIIAGKYIKKVKK